ncbi:jg10634 [Pararge aegeria aegeria]|uniref:Jg10634 protein n=1 Tax=Pararge aegeria aegeria TaxID=348720 RepID=A0A8S4R9T0_9NEOP|nr:jg10634 [Pararge aegeria aegeria]
MDSSWKFWSMFRVWSVWYSFQYSTALTASSNTSTSASQVVARLGCAAGSRGDSTVVVGSATDAAATGLSGDTGN